MVKKRIIGALLSFVVVIALMAGVLHYSGYTISDFVSETTSAELEDFFDENGLFKPVKDNTKKTITDLSKAFEIILHNGTKDFYGGYPIDQSFLLWMNKTYGDELIMDIAYRMYEGYGQKDLWYRETGNTLHVLWLKYCEDLQYATYYLKNVHWMEDAADDGVITIDFTGDINLADDWYTMTEAATRENGIYDCISEEVMAELQSADISVINNEFVFTDGSDCQTDKAYTFGAKTENVILLDAFGADLANLANNHTYDYRESGLMDTIETLRAHGVITVGAGADLNEAKAVQYFVIKGRKIAFVSATEIERYAKYTKAATETEAGVLKTQNMEAFESAIKEASRNSDFVVAIVHWGDEGKINYTGAQYSMASRLVHAGADVVIGGHPHRLQGVEFVGEAPVAFSLGNFWFSTGTLYTTIAQLQIDGDGKIAFRMIPCIQKDLTTSILPESETESFYKFVADVSRSIAIDEEGYIHNTANGVTDEILEVGQYYSGMAYESHTGLKDLEDRIIDIVGNLQ